MKVKPFTPLAKSYASYMICMCLPSDFGFLGFYTAQLTNLMSFSALSLAGTVIAFWMYLPSYQAYKNITQFINNSKDPTQAGMY